ncbi:MAG: alpha-ketoacid dehydrogenase subunit beta [Deinococcota bacterium]
MTQPLEVNVTDYRSALRKALAEGMTEDARVVILGEEVGRYGGAYAVTKGLYEHFGASRVLDTPISEAAIVGTAIGAAMTGLRPVAELMYVDFAGLAMDQIANQAAKIRYMFGGQVGVPMVLRMQGGTGRSAGAQHSQSLEAWLMHVPGLRVYMPATVSDAYYLLKAALQSDDPVMFLEHKSLYTHKGELEDDALPVGKAAVRKSGTDITLISYSRMLHRTLEAAKLLAQEDDVNAEVIDLRTLNPLDSDTLAESVSRTGRAVVISEDTFTGSVAAELVARLQVDAFDFLEAPILRVCGEDIPIPVSPELEAAAVPDVMRIVQAARLALSSRQTTGASR